MTAMAGYDPMSKAAQEDPWDWYERGRTGCPVHRYEMPAELLRGESTNHIVAKQPTEFYSVFRYDDVRKIASNSDLYSSAFGPGPEYITALNKVGMLIYADEPAHRQQRRIVGKALTPRAVADLEPEIRSTTKRLIDAFAADGRVDLIPALCDALPGAIFSKVLGVSPDDHDMFKRWTDGMVNAFGGDEHAEQLSVQIMVELAQYFLGLIGERREVLAAGGTLPDDLITALMLSEYEGKQFDDTDILLAVHVMLVGGHETTTAALANIGYLFAVHPDQLDLIRADRSLIPNAMEEILRYDAPVNCVFRTPKRTTELHGVTLEKDTKTRIVWGSANRDPSVFTDPARFDVTRDSVRRHMGFGAGIHACVGAALARLEMTAAIETLLDTLGSWRLDPDHPPVRGDNLVVRRFASLPLIWDAP
jgi:cytochrome P450